MGPRRAPGERRNPVLSLRQTAAWHSAPLFDGAFRSRTAANRPALEPAHSPPRLLRVSAESVTLIPSCVECDARWLAADEKRWRAYLTDDEPPEVVSYCPDCAEREFGGG